MTDSIFYNIIFGFDFAHNNNVTEVNPKAVGTDAVTRKEIVTDCYR